MKIQTATHSFPPSFRSNRLHEKKILVLEPFHAQISRQMSLGTYIPIYNMKNQFWAGLGSQASTVKKKFGADYEQLLRLVFLSFHGQKN